MKKLVFMMTTLFLANIAQAQINCNLVELFGNLGQSYIEDQINDRMMGKSIRINKRKTLKLRYAHSLSFTGCKMRLKAKVKLKRKIRKDAIGNITFTANVRSFSREQICLGKTKVVKIALSNTGGLGESFYKLIANKAIPDNSCFEL